MRDCPKNAFVIIINVHEVLGEGFKPIEGGMNFISLDK